MAVHTLLGLPCEFAVAQHVWVLLKGYHLSPSPSVFLFMLVLVCSCSQGLLLSKSGILVSHRPGRASLGFGGYRWYPPGLAPPAAFATGSHFWPHSFILLQFQMDLLALYAVSLIHLSFLLLSPPPIPMSFSKFAIDDAGKPRQPTSTA